MRPEPTTIRVKILAVIETATRPLTGREIARMARLNYKQTIDGLNALHNHARVERRGRKHTAHWEWTAPPPSRHPLDVITIAHLSATKRTDDAVE